MNDTKTEAAVKVAELEIAAHHRLDPMTSRDRCKCGYKAEIGKMFTNHIARAVIAALKART